MPGGKGSGGGGGGGGGASRSGGGGGGGASRSGGGGGAGRSGGGGGAGRSGGGGGGGASRSGGRGGGGGGASRSGGGGGAGRSGGGGGVSGGGGGGGVSRGGGGGGGSRGSVTARAGTGGHGQAYIDGSCRGNGTLSARAGIGGYFPNHSQLNFSKPLGGGQTNNRAEIQAGVKALHQASNAGITHMKLYTDSQQVSNAWNDRMPGASGWRSNGYRGAGGSAIRDANDYRQLDAVASRFQKVEISHIPGHAKVHGNLQAHDLAVQGANSSRQ